MQVVQMKSATRVLSGLALLAVCALGAPSPAAAQAQDVTVVNTPSNPVFNQPQADTSPVLMGSIAQFENGELFHDAPFPMIADGERLIVDYISVEGVEGGGHRMWATFRPCTNWPSTRIALPLSFGGGVGNESVWQGQVHMQVPVTSGCPFVVRAWRTQSGTYANAKVTIQGHMVTIYSGRASGQ